MIDVSVVVTFHNEKILAHQTLSSISRARKHAESHGLATELVAVFDRADMETEAVVRNHPDFLHQSCAINVDNGDAGTSRNDGVKIARGNIICIADGDDYFSQNWLERSAHCLKALGNKTILHPEIVVSFGDTHSYHRQIDQSDPTYNVAGLFSYNYWVSWASSRKETFEQCPYQRTSQAESGFGYEDWHWNCETTAAGYVHHIAKKTVGFYRRKSSGIWAAENRSSAITKPTALFDPTRVQTLFFEKCS